MDPAGGDRRRKARGRLTPGAAREREDDIEYTESGQPVYRHSPANREFEPAFGDQRTIEAISRHVGRYVGPVAHVFHELVSDLVHVDVHLVPPQPNRDFVTLVTSGMSDRPMTLPPDCDAPDYAELADVPAVRLAARSKKISRTRRISGRSGCSRSSPGCRTSTTPGSGSATPSPTATRRQPFDDSTDTVLRPDRAADAVRRAVRATCHVRRQGDPVLRRRAAFTVRRWTSSSEHGTEELLRRFAAVGISELLDPRRPNVCRRGMSILGSYGHSRRLTTCHRKRRSFAGGRPAADRRGSGRAAGRSGIVAAAAVAGAARERFCFSALGVGAVVYIALLIVGGQGGQFAADGIEVLPFVALALFAYAGEQRLFFAVLTLVYWAVLVGVGDSSGRRR